MNLKKPRRQARLLFALGSFVLLIGLVFFRGGGFNEAAARFLCAFVFVSSGIYCWMIELLYSRKARRAAMRAERKAAEQGKIVVGMSPPIKRVRSRVWQERGTFMPGSPPAPTDVSDMDLDALVESAFTDTDYDDGFILWEGPQRPPKDGKLTDLGGTVSDYEPLAVFTADASKQYGYAISAPANASVRASAQTARLKKYE